MGTTIRYLLIHNPTTTRPDSAVTLFTDLNHGMARINTGNTMVKAICIYDNRLNREWPKNLANRSAVVSEILYHWVMYSLKEK